MTQCSRCRAPLSPGSMVCPSCGLAFAAPVPAEVPLPAPGQFGAPALAGSSAPAPAGYGASSPRPAPPARRLPVWVWVLGVLGALALAVVGLAFLGYRSFQNRLTAGLSVQEAGAGQQGSWTPSAAATAQLAPPFQMSGPLGYYTVQPPAGYTLHGTKLDAADGKSRIYTWVGPMNEGGTAPQFVLSFGSDGGVMTSHLSSAQDVAIGLRSAGRDHTQLVTSPVQSGSINGLSFSRGYWKGLGARTGRRFHGLVYCQIASPNLINIYAKDSEPSSRSTLPVLEAAALSLRLVKRME